jgi:hypothetical protein
LTLSDVPLTHHEPPRESSLINGITGHRSSQQEFCNTIGEEADIRPERRE